MKDSNFGFIRMRAPACEKPLELRGKEFLVPQWIVGLVPLPLIYRDTVAQSCWESVCSYKRNLYAKCECLSKTCCMWNVLFQRVHSIVYPLISFRVERSERERPTLVRAISSSSLKNSATFLQVSKKWHETIYLFCLLFSFFPFLPFTFLRKHSNAWESWIDVFSNHKFKTPMSFCEDHFITNLSMGMQINICLNDFDYAWRCLRHLIYVVFQNGERMRKNHPRLRIALGPGLNIYYQ